MLNTYRRSRAGWWSITILLIVVISVLEHRSTVDMTFAFLYFGPIAIAGWCLGFREALFCIAAITADWAFSGWWEERLFSHWWVPYWNATLRSSALIFMAALVEQVRANLARERHLARRDPLTGLWNLRGFCERMEIESTWSRRTQEPVTVAYMDLDNFKQVNDRWGHQTGNRVLQMITDILRNNLREIDTPARLGGDEFAVILPRTSADNARTVFSKIQTALRAAMQEHHWGVTLSIGLVTYTQLPSDVPQILAAADALMYSVKRQGKDQITKMVRSN